MEKSVLIIGAGPAGLTAGYLLTQAGWKVTLLEADPTYVGGISKTVSHKGFHFDIGGHRFFSKSEEVNKLWREILPDDFIETPRSSRIYYRNELFSYPLKGFEALKKLGLVEAILCVLSYRTRRLSVLFIRTVQKGGDDYAIFPSPQLGLVNENFRAMAFDPNENQSPFSSNRFQKNTTHSYSIRPTDGNSSGGIFQKFCSKTIAHQKTIL